MEILLNGKARVVSVLRLVSETSFLSLKFSHEELRDVKLSTLPGHHIAHTIRLTQLPVPDLLLGEDPAPDIEISRAEVDVTEDLLVFPLTANNLRVPSARTTFLL